MGLDSIYFNQIREGKKIYEVRIFDEKRKKIRLLDKIIFRNKGDPRLTFEARFIELSYFPDFREAIEEVGIKKVLPSTQSLEKGVRIYNSFNDGGYEKDAKKYGVLRMRFQLL